MTAPAHATPFDALADAVSQALVILLNLDSFGATPTGIADALTAASEAGRALDRARRAAVDADRESGSAVLHLTAEESEVLNRALTPGLARDRRFDAAAQDSEDRAMELSLYLLHSAQPGLDPEAKALLEMFRLARERREEEWGRYIATWNYPAMLTGRPVAAEAVTDSDETETDARD